MASLVLDTSNYYYEPQMQPVLSSTPLQNGNKKKIKNCQCCPYGYHIDLDFVRYCEELAANSKPPSDAQIIRRNKRRQRKSKEFMLGVDIPFTQQFYQYQIQQNFSPIVFQLSADDSSRLLNSVNYNNAAQDFDSIDSNEQSLIRKRASSMPVMTMKENSAFVKDILFDVCSDFERTLERSLSNSKPKRYTSTRPYDIQINDVSPNLVVPKHIIRQQNNQQSRIVHIESIESKVYNRNDTKIIDLGNLTINIGNGVAHMTTDNGMLPTGRTTEGTGHNENDSEENHAHSLKKQAQIISNFESKTHSPVERTGNLQVKELEEIFSKQNNHEKNENRNVHNAVNQTKHVTEEFFVTRNSSPFSPQRVCAMSLDSLKLRSSPKFFFDGSGNSSVSNEYILSSAKSTPVQQIVQSQRDVGCMAHTPLSRSIGTLTTPSVAKELKTASTNTVIIQEKVVTIQQGQQTDQRMYTQEELEFEISKSLERYQKQQQRTKQLNSCTVGTQSDVETSKKQRSVSTTTDPVKAPSHSVGTMVKPDAYSRECQTVVHSHSIGTNTDNLTMPSMPSKSLEELSASKEDLEHRISLKSLDKFKCTSTQCVLLTDEPKSERIVSTHTKGLQHSPKVSTKSVQVGVRSQPESTDTNDLVLLINRSINTDAKAKTCDQLTNTDPIAKKTKDIGVNCDPPVEKVKVEEIKKTESVNDVGNTCMAKVEIKQRTVISGLNKTDEEQQVDPQTRIPRPMALISPRPERKFNRQNTYTISAPTSETTNSTTTSVVNRSTAVKTHQQEAVATRRNEETSTSSIRCPAEEYLERVGSMSAHSSPKPIHKAISTSIPSSSSVTASPARSPPIVRKHAYVCGEQKSETNADNARDVALWRPATSSAANNIPQTSSASSARRQKAKPSKEMLAALKVINDSLQKCQQLPTNLKNANKIVQKEWFHISSTESANPLDVEDYLDCFEEFSPELLKYVVNLSDSNGNTAMHYAVSHGNFDVVSILLDSKVCCVNQTNNAGYTCVMLVSLAKLVNPEHQTVVQRLFHISDVNIRAKKHNQTALMLAVSHGNYDMVHMLLEAGAEINIQDEDGSTALMCAAEHGRIDIIKLLLAHPDCDSSIQDVDNSTALKIALEAGFRDIGVLLYAHEHMSQNRSPQSSIRRSGLHSSSFSSSTTNVGGNETTEGGANTSGNGLTKKMPL